MKSNTTCAAIGEGNLLLCCLRELLDNHIDVKAVFTNSDCVKSMCDNNNIQCYKRNANLFEVLRKTNIDYLFSIANPTIVKEDVLALPRKLTINYHDSPLPAYAGVHATSWAIMNGERYHGISWHVVEAGIDTGDILESEVVELLDEDTAFSLNIKCVEAAKCAFKRLVSSCLRNDFHMNKQPDVGRTYFGLYAIPPNVGTFRFDGDVSSIYNLGRALEFGNHDNSLGCPKVQTSRGEFFLVTNVSTQANYVCRQNYLPGTILDTVDDSIIVSTKSTPLLVSIANLDGSTVPESSYRKHGLAFGETLNQQFSTCVDDLNFIRKKESFWRRKMSLFEPTVFYRQRMNVVAGIIDVSPDIRMKCLTLPLPQTKSDIPLEGTEMFLQACFIAFLARINCTSTVHVGLLANKKDIPNECKPLYSAITPGIFTTDLNANAKSSITECMTALNIYINSGTFLTDMFYRYPELREQKMVPHYNVVIGRKPLDITEKDFTYGALHDCNVMLLFNDNRREIEIVYNEHPAQDFSHVVNVLRHFPTFLTSMHRSGDTANLKDLLLVQKDEMVKFYSLPKSRDESHVPNAGLLHLVHRQCELTPLSIAIKTTKHVFTYSKMQEEIVRLQNKMKAVLPEDNDHKPVIAVHLPNSIAYVVAILAAGGCEHAFLPLPVDFPTDRLLFTIRDAKIKQMITTSKIFERSYFNGLSSYMKVALRHRIAGEDIIVVNFTTITTSETYTRMICDVDSIYDFTTPCSRYPEEDFSYVMYTSGSTGRPKGVKVKESSVVNMARAQINGWDLGSGDVIAQFASIGFDATVSEIFTSLLSGASMAILAENERLGSDFLSAMNKMKVSTITLPPSALNVYSPSDLPTLTNVVTAGEACTLATAVKWTANGDVRFFNAYGPTEGTVCATCFEYIPGTRYEDVNRELPIGKAIDGVSVYLFDDFMNPIPPDVVGELYIGGRGLAHGYIGHASRLTSDRFIKNPLDPDRSFLYKTGDHAFQDCNGDITYVGRMDDQLKIRGHRVDLSEIEQVLTQHPKIEMAVVVVHKCSTKSDLSIAAFVAPTFIYISELREYLAKVLPKYMIPTYIKKLEVTDLPKTLNGKVNRKRLEMDESIHEQLSVGCHSHLNETQLLVAKNWCKIFKFDESFVYNIHRQSSFSELGGNSLQLVLLLRLIEDDIENEFSFTDLGLADTIEEFAEAIRRRQDVQRKCETTDLRSKEELRELIYHDSELYPSFFPHHERRRSIQFTHFNNHRFPSLKRPKNILISGVTGFLGAFLLSELLRKTDAHICCMVRETTETRGIGRIIDNMRKYGLWQFEYTQRIAVVISDLSQKRLGIAPDIYKSLCDAIDVVFMNAALMNFNTPYEDHRVANVEGTKEFIKFCSTGVQKYIFATSSLSVFLFPPENDDLKSGRQIYKEADFLDDPLLIEGGYGQSKWASERLLMQALDFLPGGAIFRPARISGRSTDGVGPRNDLFASILIGMQRFGCHPDMDFPFDLTPVDYCANAMVEVALQICNNQSSSYEKVYHLFNSDTIPFHELFSGMALESHTLQQWRKELKNAPEENKELIPLTPFFLSEFWDRAVSWPVFETVNVDRIISDDTKGLLKPTRELLGVYKSFFGV